MSLVDVSKDAAVEVELEIPSMDASSFTVRATFQCTVNDPIAVVQEGTSDIAKTLEVYLKSHYPLEEIGRAHNLEEINDVRRILNAQAEAFTTFMPPKLPGVQVKFASAQVLTPSELTGFYNSVREETFRSKLEILQQRNMQQQQSTRSDFEHKEADLAHAHRNDLQSKQLRHELDRYQLLTTAVPSDMVDMMRYAVTTGAMSHIDFLNTVSQMQRESDEYDRETYRREWEAVRADRRVELQAKVEVIQGLIARGHLDTVALSGLEDAIDELLNRSSDHPDRARPSPRSIEANPPDVADDDLVEVREEDGP
ncbi:hypothetical protein [Nocardia sp. NPDC050710]|uniref:hypothetical protein n=1 Tax=Nocardia sp. NPDC050710 TaxID=3157220 RepID=UPI0033E16F4A